MNNIEKEYIFLQNNKNNKINNKNYFYKFLNIFKPKTSLEKDIDLVLKNKNFSFFKEVLNNGYIPTEKQYSIYLKYIIENNNVDDLNNLLKINREIPVNYLNLYYEKHVSIYYTSKTFGGVETDDIHKKTINNFFHPSYFVRLFFEPEAQSVIYPFLSNNVDKNSFIDNYNYSVGQYHQNTFDNYKANDKRKLLFHYRDWLKNENSSNEIVVFLTKTITEPYFFTKIIDNIKKHQNIFIYFINRLKNKDVIEYCLNKIDQVINYPEKKQTLPKDSVDLCIKFFNALNSHYEKEFNCKFVDLKNSEFKNKILNKINSQLKIEKEQEKFLPKLSNEEKLKIEKINILYETIKNNNQSYDNNIINNSHKLMEKLNITMETYLSVDEKSRKLIKNFENKTPYDLFENTCDNIENILTQYINDKNISLMSKLNINNKNIEKYKNF